MAIVKHENIKQVFSAQGIFAPREYLAMSGDRLVTWGVLVSCRVEDRGAAWHPTVHRTAPPTNCLAQKVSSTKVENPA